MKHQKTFIVTVNYDKNVHINGVVKRAIDAYPVLPGEGNVDIKCSGVQEIDESMSRALALIDALRQDMRDAAARECAEND